MQAAVPTKGDPSWSMHLISFKPYATLHSSGTPFGAKIELMLRLAGLPYQAHNGNVMDKRTCPKHKVGSASNLFAPLYFHLQSSIYEANPKGSLDTAWPQEVPRRAWGGHEAAADVSAPKHCYRQRPLSRHIFQQSWCPAVHDKSFCFLPELASCQAPVLPSPSSLAPSLHNP
jgi:hypothetical protein